MKLAKKEQQTSEYLGMNPLGKVRPDMRSLTADAYYKHTFKLFYSITLTASPMI